jgi:hypothetical protein
MTNMQPDTDPYLTDCEPIDWAEYERWARLSPGARIQNAINAHRLAANLLRGSLRQRYPDLSDLQITRLMLAHFYRDY